MSVSQIAARYIPPTSVYLADLKAMQLGPAISGAAKASRAHNAEDAFRELALVEDRLIATLEAVQSALAELDPSRAEDGTVVSIDSMPASLRPAAEAAAKVVGRLVPRAVPAKSAGAMGVAVPVAAAAE